MHSQFRLRSRNVLLANTDRLIGGYSDKEIPALQKRMIETLESIPGVKFGGHGGEIQPLTMGGTTGMVFTDKTADLLPANAATTAYQYNVTPEYLRSASTGLLLAEICYGRMTKSLLAWSGEPGVCQSIFARRRTPSADISS